MEAGGTGCTVLQNLYANTGLRCHQFPSSFFPGTTPPRGIASTIQSASNTPFPSPLRTVACARQTPWRRQRLGSSRTAPTMNARRNWNLTFKFQRYPSVVGETTESLVQDIPPARTLDCESAHHSKDWISALQLSLAGARRGSPKPLLSPSMRIDAKLPACWPQ